MVIKGKISGNTGKSGFSYLRKESRQGQYVPSTSPSQNEGGCFDAPEKRFHRFYHLHDSLHDMGLIKVGQQESNRPMLSVQATGKQRPLSTFVLLLSVLFCHRSCVSIINGAVY